jgi:hypothetical protein
MSAHEVAIAHEKQEAAEVIGEAAVKFAMATNDMELTLKHIRLGASPNVHNANGWTAMMLFSLRGWYDGVKELLDLGALFNVAENDGWTPLMFACHNGAANIVELLLSVGADFHHKSNDGRSAIDIALANQHAEVIQRLRNAGAVPSEEEAAQESQQSQQQTQEDQSEQQSNTAASVPPETTVEDTVKTPSKPKPEIKRSNFNARNAKKEEKKAGGFFNFW